MARPEVPLSAKRGSPLAEFPLALHLRRGETGALHQQLTAQLRAGVLNGTLPAGLRLPGSRLLAHSLGVTRGVVAEAYAALVADGTLEAMFNHRTSELKGKFAVLSPVPSGTFIFFYYVCYKQKCPGPNLCR